PESLRRTGSARPARVCADTSAHRFAEELEKQPNVEPRDDYRNGVGENLQPDRVRELPHLQLVRRERHQWKDGERELHAQNHLAVMNKSEEWMKNAKDRAIVGWMNENRTASFFAAGVSSYCVVCTMDEWS